MKTVPEPSIANIARAFLHLGLTAFGGLAMVEPMRRMTVEQRGWLRQEEVLDGLALCQMMPGAMVQLGTYIGYRLQRVAGAFTAAAAFILPAFVLMSALSFLYFTYTDISWVQAVSRDPVDAPGNSRHLSSLSGHAGPGDLANGPGGPHRRTGYTLNRGDGHRPDRL
jgi:hypothetical protein